MCLFSLLHTSEPNLKNSQQRTTTQTSAFGCWQCWQYLLGTMLLAPLCCSLVTAHLEDEPDSNPKGSTTEHHRGPRCVGHQQSGVRCQMDLSFYHVRGGRAERTPLQQQTSSGQVAQVWLCRAKLQHGAGQEAEQQVRTSPFPIQWSSCQKINLCLVLPSLTKCCAAILHRTQVSRAGLIFANTMTGLIYSQL